MTYYLLKITLYASLEHSGSHSIYQAVASCISATEYLEVLLSGKTQKSLITPSEAQ